MIELKTDPKLSNKYYNCLILLLDFEMGAISNAIKSSTFFFQFCFEVEDMTFDTPPPPKSSWLATSPAWGLPFPPQYSIDETDAMFHTTDGDSRHWIQIDITEARIIQSVSIRCRVTLEERIGGIQFRVGLEAVGHTNIQVSIVLFKVPWSSWLNYICNNFQPTNLAFKIKLLKLKTQVNWDNVAQQEERNF